jgi:hypothetical protein
MADMTVEKPVALHAARVRLGIYAALAAVSAIADAPRLGTIALMFSCFALPLALAAIGGPQLVRSLFFIPTTTTSTIEKDELA